MAFSVDGHLIDYETRGEGSPLVIVHGLAHDRRLMIEACEPVFAADSPWRRIYVDLPGHGASTGNPERASADDLVHALARFLVDVVTVDGARAALVGHSYGGYLAQAVVPYVSGLRGLFLSCPTVEPDFGKRTVPGARVAVREEGLEFADDVEEAAFAEVAVRHTRATLEAFRRAVHPGNLASDRAFIAATRERYSVSRHYFGALQRFEQPVTIVCGRDDHWVGFEDAVRLVWAFRNVRYAIVPDTGNLLPVEAPEAFQELLSGWLACLR